jgi:hypothetical protein
VNVAVATCIPTFVDSDIYSADYWGREKGKCVRSSTGYGDSLGENRDKINFITPKQDKDLADDPRTPQLIYDQLPKLLHAVAYLNNEGVIHGDAHFGNVAWIGDRLVLHDWGRSFIGVEGFKNFISGYGLDTPEVRERLGKYQQWRRPCEMLTTCPIKLKDDETSRRFIKIFDTLAILGSAEDSRFVTKEKADKFSRQVEALWHNSAVPTQDMMDQIHTYIDEMFDNASAPVAPVVPVPEVTPPPPPPPGPPPESVIVQLVDLLTQLKEAGTRLRITLRPAGQSTEVANVDGASIDADIGGVSRPWIYLKPVPGAAAIVTGLGYETIPENGHLTIDPPRIILEETSDPAVKSLYLPISIGGGLYEIDTVPPAGGRRKNRALTRRFCRCIKKVRKTVKNEKGPIAICVKSVLQKKGRTLKRFTCGKKGRVITQKAKH